VQVIHITVDKCTKYLAAMISARFFQKMSVQTTTTVHNYRLYTALQLHCNFSHKMPGKNQFSCTFRGRTSSEKLQSLYFLENVGNCEQALTGHIFRA